MANVKTPKRQPPTKKASQKKKRKRVALTVLEYETPTKATRIPKNLAKRFKPSGATCCFDTVDGVVRPRSAMASIAAKPIATKKKRG